MPELPEVEYARRDLEGWLLGRRIERVVAPVSRVLRDQSPAALKRFVKGRTAAAIERKGKHLIVRLDADRGLYLHLGMSGRLLRIEGPKPSHVRLELELDDGERVALRDPRMFGAARGGPYPELVSRFFDTLGPDPFLENVGGPALQRIFGHRKRPIKVALLEQKLLAGIGNIQAAEILYIAKVSPSSPANDLSANDYRRISTAMKKSIANTLRDLAATNGEYVSEGAKNRFRVYGRAGELCRRCRNSEIERIEQAGRSTFLCPHCQREKPR